MASAPISTADFSNRPKGCRPTPMMATSLLMSNSLNVGSWRERSSLDRLERERDELVAVGVRGERNHGEFHLHAELQLLRIVFRQPTLDAHHVAELHEPDPEGDEVLARRPHIRRPRCETLRRPCDHRAAPWQQHVAHLGLAALRTMRLHGEHRGPTRRTSATD